jgi:hypothetical protein
VRKVIPFWILDFGFWILDFERFAMREFQNFKCGKSKPKWHKGGALAEIILLAHLER